MAKIEIWPIGTWVEIGRSILLPGERAPQVPADTAAVPLDLCVKGFLQEAATLGQQASITTLTGRTQAGKVTSINPRHTHDFGDPIPELLAIGMELRQLLEGCTDEQ